MDEDVFNALTEILYFKHQVTTSSPHDPAVPSCLFLPTSFLTDAIQPLIAGIQTQEQEQLDNLLNSFHGIQCVIFCLIG